MARQHVCPCPVWFKTPDCPLVPLHISDSRVYGWLLSRPVLIPSGLPGLVPAAVLQLLHWLTVILNVLLWCILLDSTLSLISSCHKLFSVCHNHESGSSVKFRQEKLSLLVCSRHDLIRHHMTSSPFLRSFHASCQLFTVFTCYLLVSGLVTWPTVRAWSHLGTRRTRLGLGCSFNRLR